VANIIPVLNAMKKQLVIQRSNGKELNLPKRQFSVADARQS
jgi:hypothetical protein